MKKIVIMLGLLLFVNSNNSFAQKQPSPKQKQKEQAKLRKNQEEKAQANHEKRVKFHEDIQTKKTRRRIKKHRKHSDRLYSNKHPVPWYKRLFKRRKKVKRKKRSKY